MTKFDETPSLYIYIIRALLGILNNYEILILVECVVDSE